MYTHLCPDGVVDCLWLNGALKCFVRSGFVYDYQVSTNITVQIPRVFENQTGDYTCQVFGSDAGDIEKCTFTLKHDSKFTPCHCASYTCTHTHSECRPTITLASVIYNFYIQEILFLSSENDITNVLSKRLCNVIIRMRLVIVSSCHRQTLSSALNLSWEPVVCEKVEQEWREEATLLCACALPFENIIWSKIIICILQPFIQRQCHQRSFLNRLWTSTSRKES